MIFKGVRTNSDGTDNKIHTIEVKITGSAPNATWNYISVPSSMKDIQTNIPNCPTTPDGTWTLQCVVSNGTPTYSWVVGGQN